MGKEIGVCAVLLSKERLENNHARDVADSLMCWIAEQVLPTLGREPVAGGFSACRTRLHRAIGFIHDDLEDPRLSSQRDCVLAGALLCRWFIRGEVCKRGVVEIGTRASRIDPEQAARINRFLAFVLGFFVVLGDNDLGSVVNWTAINPIVDRLGIDPLIEDLEYVYQKLLTEALHP